MRSVRRWRGSWRAKGRRASPSARSTTPGRRPAPTSITTAASASCPRRPARISRRPSKCPSSGWPYAYVIPRQHQDSLGLVTLLGILHRGQVEIRTALHPIALGGQRFPAGSYVVVLRQPYAAFAKTLLEPQRYPDLRLYPGGPPLPPYDVTAHTLPLLMGVTAVPAHDSLRIGLSSPVEPPTASPSDPRFAGPDAPRVGLYRSYAAPIDEGWTRWVFDTWKVPYTSLVDSVVRAGKLRGAFDVVVLPDQSPHEL